MVGIACLYTGWSETLRSSMSAGVIVRLRDLLDIPELRIALRAGAGSVDRPIRWVYVTELLDPSRYLTGNELVLTGLMWRQRP
jgi:Purine catabolism regulatory protein-like family